jgi:PAS domain S-box-containing protein
LPSNIGDLVQKVISRNSPKKIEVKAGKRIYSVAFHPLPDKKCVNIYGFDISEQKELEEKLRESEVRFRSAFDDSAVAMALVDQDARIPRVNDAFCRMLGFEKSEIEGHSFLDFTYPDDMKPSILAHKAVINNEKPFLWIEKRYIRKDGRVIWCDVSSSPVLDAKGCPIYTVAHIQDITERKKAEEILKKAHDSSEEKVKERTTELEKAYECKNLNLWLDYSHMSPPIR